MSSTGNQNDLDLLTHQAATRFANAIAAERELSGRSPEQAVARSLSVPWSQDDRLAKKLARLAAGAESVERVAAALAADRTFQSLIRKYGMGLVHPRSFQIKKPPTLKLRWEGLPENLSTPGDLAEWLGLRSSELDWFAGCCRDHPGRPDSWRHYHCRWIPKRHGPDRLIETPKPYLKSIQRKLLRELVEIIPLHEAAHGFRAGRSIKTFAQPHANRHLVLRMDLADFFPSIRQSRLVSLFRWAGFPGEVASRLAGLCCHATPETFLDTGRQLSWESRKRLRIPHLPQGAPTSPALSNAVAYRFDRRLAGLAESAGAFYTRYADDLAFSGSRSSEFARGSERFARHVAAIALEEGFGIAHRKTRFMRANQCQSVAGVVVNVRPNAKRILFDELKAILHRCETRGVAGTVSEGESAYEFRQRLLGRISAFSQLNQVRGARLRSRFDSLEWID